MKIAELEDELKKSDKKSVISGTMLDMLDIHDLQPASKYFKVEGLRVQYCNDKNWTHYIFNQPIKPNKSSKFKIKIAQTSSRDIILGVVDYARQKDERKSFNSGNALCYWGINGKKFP